MAPTPRERMRLWDAVTGMHPVDAAVRCLTLTRPDLADPAALPLGVRDAALLALRRELAGDHLGARAVCPSCGDPASLDLSVAALLEAIGADQPTRTRWELEHEGRTLAVRALTSRDLASALRCGDGRPARMELVRAALGAAPHDRDPDEGTAARVAASLAEHDRGAEVLLDCHCAACGTRWHDALDVAAFVAAELAHQGGRLLVEVAELAQAFGWAEEAILDLPDARRRAYLALAVG